MIHRFSLATTSVCAACILFTAVYAATPTSHEERTTSGNAYHLFTSALPVDDAGVAEIPARFRWSVETSQGAFDAQGKPLPDSRVRLRLYDPDHNFTAFLATMDLDTAAMLHRELGDLIEKKRQNPGFQHQPRLYRPDQIPTKRFVGIGADGKAIVEEVPDR